MCVRQRWHSIHEKLERGIAVSSRWWGHSISEIVVTLDNRQSAVSLVDREYLMGGNTASCGQRNGQTMNPY